MLDFSKLRRTSRTSHIFIGFIAFSSDLLVTKICLLVSVYSVHTHSFLHSLFNEHLIFIEKNL